MNKQKVHSILESLFYACDKVVRAFSGPAIPVLCLHSVRTGPSRLSVSPQEFEDMLRWFSAKGYQSIFPEDLGNREKRKNGFIITFDDGYKDNLSTALPLLEKYGYKAVIFITTGIVGKENNFARDKMDVQQMLTWDDILTLSQKGWHIESHFVTHRNLPQLSSMEISQEFIESKSVIQEEVSGTSVSNIAYPRGKVNDIAKDALRNAGVVRGFCGKNRGIRTSDDNLALPRIEITSGMTPLRLTVVTSTMYAIAKKIVYG